MIPKHVKQNASAIGRYLELVFPHYERSGNFTDLPPLNRKAKGKGDAPVGEHALRLMWNNRGSRMVLEPYLEELKESADNWGGVKYREVLGLVVYDPGQVRTWNAAKSSEAPPASTEEALQRAEDALYATAYREMCKDLAYAVEARYPGLELIVTTDPDDEPVDTFEQGRSRDANKVKTHNAHTRYPILVREVDEIKREMGCSDKDALAIWNESRPKKENVSRGTLYNARAYVKGQLVEGRDGQIGYSRLLDEESA